MIGVVLLAVVALVVAVVFSGGNDRRTGPASSPRQAVQMYLEALAAADAAGLRAITTTVGSDVLLGGPVLRTQRDRAPIVDIAVAEQDRSNGEISASYRMGGRAVDVRFRVVREAGRWLVANGVVEIHLQAGRVPDPTFFGVPVGRADTAYVYPGPQLWGSTNRYLAVVAVGDKPYPVGPDAPETVRLDARLGQVGVEAVRGALARYFDACAASHQTDAALDRPGCRQKLYRSARPGSVRWTSPTDIADLYSNLSAHMVTTVDVAGAAQWRAEYSPTYEPESEARTATVDQYLVGTVDLKVEPPAFTAQ